MLRLAISALKAHRVTQNHERLCLGQGYADQDLFLARADGSPWPPSQFSSEFARLVKKTDNLIRFHELRRTHASQLLRQGTPVKAVSERLGRSATSVTMDTYTHTLPGMDREAIERLDSPGFVLDYRIGKVKEIMEERPEVVSGVYDRLTGR